jgi:hypothetical protein
MVSPSDFLTAVVSLGKPSNVSEVYIYQEVTAPAGANFYYFQTYFK